MTRKDGLLQGPGSWPCGDANPSRPARGPAPSDRPPQQTVLWMIIVVLLPNPGPLCRYACARQMHGNHSSLCTTTNGARRPTPDVASRLAPAQVTQRRAVRLCRLASGPLVRIIDSALPKNPLAGGTNLVALYGAAVQTQTCGRRGATRAKRASREAELFVPRFRFSNRSARSRYRPKGG